MAVNKNVKNVMILQKKPQFTCHTPPSSLFRIKRRKIDKSAAPKKKGELAFAFCCFGGVDGARTRDPRRDRPVF
jgi:hypothetical protein